jgi:HEAT repeat protein
MPDRLTRKQVGLWSLVTFLFGLLVWTSLPKGPLEPEWKGRTLSQWLDTPDFIGVYEYRPTETVTNKEAIEAIRAMGTNCLPWLLARLTRHEEPGQFRAWLDGLARKVEHSVGQIPWETHQRQHTRRETQAIAAFSMLGELAAPAVPQLWSGLQGHDNRLAQFASANALGALGDSGVSVLLSAVTNADARVRQYAVSGLGSAASRHDVAVAALFIAATDSERRVRQFVSLALVQFTNHSSSVVPVFTNLMADSDKVVRHSAMIGLRMYGGDRTLAIPALEVAASDPDARVSNSAKEILDQLRLQSAKPPP